MDRGTRDDKARLARELMSMEEGAAYSGQSQLQQAKFWRGVNLMVGVPAAILAAISGATGLSSVANRGIVAYLGLGAAHLDMTACALPGQPPVHAYCPVSVGGVTR